MEKSCLALHMLTRFGEVATKQGEPIMKTPLIAIVAVSCALFCQQARADSISFIGGTVNGQHDSSVFSPTTVTFSPATDWHVNASSGVFAGTRLCHLCVDPA